MCLSSWAVKPISGGSDSPLSAEKGEYDRAKERCGGSDAWNLPAVFGPIAMSYNLPEVDGLVLDGPTLAKIFNGTVTNWNAPEGRRTERRRVAAR